MPTGGTTGQALVKQSDDNFALDWATISEDSGGTPDDGSVTTPKLADGAVTEPKLADSAVTTNKLGFGAVTREKIAQYAVGNRQLEDNAVSTDVVADAAITNSKLANKSATLQKWGRPNYYVNNAGTIEPGVDGNPWLMPVYGQNLEKSQAIENARWVGAEMDDIFDLGVIHVGTEDNPSVEQNFVLEHRAGAIKANHIRPPWDLENLIGISFVTTQDSYSHTAPLLHRLTTPWVTEGESLFTLNPNLVSFTVPNKKTARTRGISHIYVVAGSVAGITDDSTRTEIIEAIENESNIYSEIDVSLSPVMALNNTVRWPGAGEYSSSMITFAENGSGAAVRTHIAANRTTTTISVTPLFTETAQRDTYPFTGNEFVAFYIARLIGG